MTGYERFVADRWSRIEDEGTRLPGGWRAMPLPVTAGGRELVQAVDAQGLHHLLIPADEAPHPENTAGPLAVSFGDFRFNTGPGLDIAGRYLDIRCRLAELGAQFDKVIGEVVDVVVDSDRPIGAALATVAAWRRLFTTLAGARPLTHQEKLAAFGELSVLRDLVTQASGFCVAAWTGPQRTPHDFELPEVSLEVKTIGEDSETITVHGLDQLAEAGDKPLYLVVRRVLEAANGRTVAELLGEVIERCDDAGLARERAARIGVYEGMDDTSRFEVVESLVGEVGECFPRITRDVLGAELTAAVEEVSYTLQLNAVRDQLVPGFGAILDMVTG